VRLPKRLIAAEADMLTAKRGPHAGSYSGLYVPDSRGTEKRKEYSTQKNEMAFLGDPRRPPDEEDT